VSIRVRLAICYGGLFGLILLCIGVLAYAIHARSLYWDLDRALVSSAGQTAAEAEASNTDPDLVEGHGGFEVIVALYDQDGALRKSSAETGTLPSINPTTALRAPAGPAYGRLVGLVPPIVVAESHPPGGAFALVATQEQRWRIYVVPVHRSGVLTGYVAGLTPLGAADASVAAFGALLLALETGGLAMGVAGSWIVSSRALRPVTQMGQTARTIARSHDFSHRIEVLPQPDELGGLAATLNEMLQSLEMAYRSQQRFVADASHELRAPLTAIQANVDLLRRQPKMSETEREEAVMEVEREASRMTRLVADLLVLARADAGASLTRRPVDLDAIVLEGFRSARPLANGRHLVLDPFEPARTQGDEDRLKQLVLILLDNALKYTPVDGTVTLGLRRQGSNAEILVRDTGIGIPPADLPHVFERFYRADPAHGRDPGGTGLGLSIAHWIAEQHGGDITLESQTDKGSTVSVHLPLEP
jgi:signal transduction histidine kinase